MGPRHHQMAMVEWAGIQATVELTGVMMSLLAVTQAVDGHKNPFVHVSRLTVGAIFGAQTRIWHSIYPTSPDDVAGRKDADQLLDQCRRMMAHAFGSSPIQQYCSRGNVGPLSCPVFVDRTTSSSTAVKPQFTVHLDPYMTFFPAAVGCPTRWTFDNLWSTGDGAIDIQTMNNLVFHQLELLGELKRESKTALGDFEIEIFASSDLSYPPEVPVDPTLGRTCEILTAGGERAMLRDAGFLALVRKRQAGLCKVGSRDTWHPATDTPPCGACGAVYERAEVEPDEGSLVKAGEGEDDA